MSPPLAYLGVDWGTHSSKWACYSSSTGKYHPDFPLYGSEMLRNGESLCFSPTGSGKQDDLIRGLKSVLIHDPLGVSFWSTEPRMDCGTSLGEAVAFSLCCLITDAIAKTTATEERKVIGISFPNWLVDGDPRTRAAAKNFKEAVAVAMELVSAIPIGELPRPGSQFSIDRWRQLVTEARPRIVAGTEFDVSNIMAVDFSSANKVLNWGFITESGAAGLPYLRAMTIEEVPGALGLAKLLVVDVGAGSTDIGYMLRTRHRETGNEKLYYFPPAPSLAVAGNELTKELISHLRAKNQKITYVEAELRKTQSGDWAQLSFVSAWIDRIAQHVREYVEGVPDERWLPLPVTLNVVITGGSGLVLGLKAAVKQAVQEGLRSRRVDRQTVNKIEAPGEHLPELPFTTEAEYARRAVSLGASDSDRPGCTFIPKMDPPTRTRIATAPKWV